MATVKELRAIAKSLGLTNYSGLLKTDLELAIAQATQSVESIQSTETTAICTEVNMPQTTAGYLGQEAAIALHTFKTVGYRFVILSLLAIYLVIDAAVLTVEFGQALGRAYYASRYPAILSTATATVIATVRTAYAAALVATPAAVNATVTTAHTIANAPIVKTTVQLIALSVRYLALRSAAAFLLGLAALPSVIARIPSAIIAGLTLPSYCCFSDPYNTRH